MNITTQSLADDERLFIDRMAGLLTSCGMPAAAARLYGLLLLHDEGPIGLDDIAHALDMSRANAWYAARALERSGHVRRVSQKGSKRVLLEISSDVVPPALAQQLLLQNMSQLLQEQASSTAKPNVAQRLQDKAEFCQLIYQAMQDAIASIRAKRQGGS